MSAHFFSPLKFFIALFCSSLIASTGFAQTLNENMHGAMKEDDPVFKQQREEWLRSMHRAEPGVQYELLDRETRDSKRRMIMQKSPADSAHPGGVYAHWVERGSNNLAGRIHTADIDFERGLIYAGSSGGHLWRGTLDGQEWTSLNDVMRIGDIRMIRCLKKGNISRIVVVGNSPTGVHYSDDDGASWKQARGLENPPKWGNLRRGIIANDALNSMYVLSVEWDFVKWRAVTGLYRSTDLGESFALLATFDLSNVSGDLFDIWTPRYSSAPVYFMHRDTLSAIAHDGSIQKLAEITIDRNFSSIRSMILQGYSDAGGTEILPLFQFDDGSARCYASTDAGAHWTFRGGVPFHMFTNNSFSVSPSNKDLMFCGGVEVYRSVNGGRSWSPVNGWGEYYGDVSGKLHADIPGISFHRNANGDEYILIGTDGGLYLSQDTMKVVSNLSLSKLNVSQYYSTYTHQKDPTVIFAGSQDQGFQRTMNDNHQTKAFDQLISGDYGHLTSGNGGTTLWCNYPGFTLLYPDALSPKPQGLSWDFGKLGRLWLPPVVAHPRKANIAFVACGGADTTSEITRLVYDSLSSTISGTAFGDMDFSLGKHDRKVSAIGISPLNPAHMYVLTNDGLFFSTTNNGATWAQADSFASPQSHYFYGSCILTSTKTLGKIVIGGSGYSNAGVSLSLDGGKTFRAIDRGLPKTLVYGLDWTTDESFIFAATEVGPYMYVAADSMWYDIGGNIAPEEVYWSVEYVPQIRTARFGTYGRGIWDYTIDKVTTVERPAAASSPTLRLSAFPNPTPGATVFTMRTDVEGSGMLHVYDMLGRLVAEPFSGAVRSGTQQILWNGVTHEGSPVPAGMYLAIFAVNGMIAHARLSIVR
jgi:hypothetical protein